jgi:hypothetical protein
VNLDLEERLRTSLEPLMQGKAPLRRLEAPTTTRHRWQPAVAVVSALAVAATVMTIILAGRVVRENSGPGTSPPPATGVVGQVVLSGGPGGGSQLQGQPVTLMISTGGHAVLSKAVASSTIVKVPLSPGTYAVSAMDGNADCETRSIHVKTGAFSSFEVVCSLR